MLKLFRVMYLGSYTDYRFVAAKTIQDAMRYILIKDIRGANAFGDTMSWGEIERIELWDSEFYMSEDEERRIEAA